MGTGNCHSQPRAAVQLTARQPGLASAEIFHKRNIIKLRAVNSCTFARLHPMQDIQCIHLQASCILAMVLILTLRSQVVMDIIDQLAACWGPPLQEAAPPEPKGPPTAASATAAHQADVAMRRCVAAAVMQLPTAEGKTAAAARLNAARRQLLSA